MFLDFNYEACFYANVLRGCEQIDHVLNSGIEVIVGSDTYNIEKVFWKNMVVFHKLFKS